MKLSALTTTALSASTSFLAPPANYAPALWKRARGCLYGQFVGDALGTRYEFSKRDEADLRVRADKKANQGFLPILGGGVFEVAPGQVTDDTELAMALARSLIRAGRFNRADVASAYREWFLSQPFDIGETTKNCFSGVSKKDQPTEVETKMVENSRTSNPPSLSNGSLMRISPLAIAGSKWKSKSLAKAAREDAMLSHAHLVAQKATEVYALALAQLIHNGDPKKAFEAAKEAAKGSPFLQSLLSAAEAGNVAVALYDKETEGPLSAAALTDTQHMGFLGVAFQWAFRALLHAESFEKALEEVVSRGGDADTNGAIVGAMLGARFGVEGIPEQWRREVTQNGQRRAIEFKPVDSKDLDNVVELLLTSVHES